MEEDVTRNCAKLAKRVEIRGSDKKNAGGNVIRYSMCMIPITNATQLHDQTKSSTKLVYLISLLVSMHVTGDDSAKGK